MTLPLAYLGIAAIEEVAVAVWAEVFEATGWLMSLVEKKSSIGHADIVDALRKDPLSDELLHALETVHELGSDAGRDAIVAAMNDRHIPLDTISQNSGEKEFSLRFYLAQRKRAGSRSPSPYRDDTGRVPLHNRKMYVKLGIAWRML
jgi:hypothetical protein